MARVDSYNTNRNSGSAISQMNALGLTSKVKVVAAGTQFDLTGSDAGNSAFISEAKVQRMRNLVTGKHKAKTATQIGYKKQQVRYVEGDVWEDRGKTWTIKNGIKQNFTKLTGLRKLIRTKCFDCNIADEHAMKLNGTYDQYERDTIGKKLDTIYENVKDTFAEFVDNVNKDYITESGHKEEWYGGLSKEQYQSLSDVELAKLRVKIDNYKKGEE